MTQIPQTPEDGRDLDVQPSTRTAWRRLLRAASPRPTKGTLLAGVLAVALGFAIAVQVRQTSNAGLEGLREGDLVRLLDTVNQDNSRLSDEIVRLEVQRDELATSTDLEQARAAAQQRLDALGILAGTTPASGPGIVMTIRDPHAKYTAAMLLDALQELRDAGAEAVQINDGRVGASTWFADGASGAVTMDGRTLSRPFVITAIGDDNTLAAAMEIPGGVSETARRMGGDTTVLIRDTVDITALRPLSTPRYALPENQASPSK
jgi:uncharacterized protein YlxW (UPF0749 family)